MNIINQNIFLNPFTSKITFASINLVFLSIILIGVIVIIKKFIYKNNLILKTIKLVYQRTRWPIIFLITLYSSYFIFVFFGPLYTELFNNTNYAHFNYLFNCIGIILFFWLSYDLIALAKEKILVWANDNKHMTTLIILPAISDSLNAAFLLMIFNLIIPYLGLTGIGFLIANKALKIMLILTLSWISYKLITVFEYIIVNQHQPANSTVITIRKLKTQVIILRRLFLSLIVIVTSAAILMTFDSVKNLGTGILTTAGLFSAIVAFASQQSLSRIFSGLQIAFSQPIRIGDTIIVDDEFGQVEEINLSYVIVKLWDLRRLIKPTDYFTKNGVLNLTRESTQLLGTVMIYCDYTLPVNLLREKFKSLMFTSKYWDKNVCELDVTDVTDKCIQIRLLLSAENADLLWKLRCEIREKIMKYIAEEHPERLARARNVSLPLK